MKLRNKKTGEVVERVDLTIREEGVVFNNDETYNSIAGLNEEWEDYEETEYYFIDGIGIIRERRIGECEEDEEARKIIGNYFETKEQAEKAVEKLKAWKRLKEASIDYKLTYEYDDSTEAVHACGSFSFNSYPLIGKDLELLFGSEK